MFMESAGSSGTRIGLLRYLAYRRMTICERASKALERRTLRLALELCLHLPWLHFTRRLDSDFHNSFTKR